jgi:hydroxymethylpyrimidine/phosphomethylpyrimidine kinase
VTKVTPLDPDLIAAQLDAVIEDIGADAVKTGMLATAPIIEAVAENLRRHKLKNIVVDPVMVATSGNMLLKKNAIETLRSDLIPLADLVTPNIPEAEALTGIHIRTVKEIQRAAGRILDLGAHAVIIKGGHRRGPAADLYFDGKKFRELRTRRIRTHHTHGTGCTFSAAIAAYLARGEKLESAVVQAKTYITAAIRHSFPIGAGQVPVHHFFRTWPK